MEKIKLIQPMKPISTAQIKVGDQYLHQIKWDGIRGLTYINDGQIKLYTKSGRERINYYPELLNLSTLFNGTNCILDGELIVFDSMMRPNFGLALQRDRISHINKINLYAEKYPICYMIFDLLMLNDTDLRKHTLLERQALLSKHVSSNNRIIIVDSFDNGENLLDLMKEKHYEGIVTKVKTSPYISGKKHNSWFKTKIYKKMLTVIGGLCMDGDNIKSLLLGINRNDEYTYIGKASLGLNSKDLLTLKDHLSILESHEQTLNGSIDKNINVVWIKPILTCWISFLEWTDKGILRHPKILGFSKDDANDATGVEYTYYG